MSTLMNRFVLLQMENWALKKDHDATSGNLPLIFIIFNLNFCSQFFWVICHNISGYLLLTIIVNPLKGNIRIIIVDSQQFNCLSTCFTNVNNCISKDVYNILSFCTSSERDGYVH